MEIAASSRVVARNDIGQFIKDCSQAAEHTVEKLINDGAKLSKQMAPSGSKPDPRTPTLREAMFSQMLSRTSGIWGNYARHALPIEFGAGPHDIPGNVRFFWDNEGRWWTPGDNTIHHPGNGAQPYLRPAYDVIAARAIAVARGEYPG